MTRRSAKPQQRSGTGLGVTTVYLASFLVLAGFQTAGAQQIQLQIIGGAGAPGGTVDVTLTLTGGAGVAVGAGLDVLFPGGTLGALSVDPATDCAIASRLASTHILQALVLPAPPGGQRLGLDVATNPPAVNFLGEGGLVTCRFHIPGTASLGSVVTLSADTMSVLVSDARGQTLPAVGVDGEVHIAVVTPTLTPTTAVATPTNTPTVQASPTLTPTIAIPTPTLTPTNIAASPTQTPTVTVSPTPTNTSRTPTNTPTFTPTEGGGGGGGGCAIAPVGTRSGRGALLWLAVPVAVLLRRRRPPS